MTWMFMTSFKVLLTTTIKMIMTPNLSCDPNADTYYLMIIVVSFFTYLVLRLIFSMQVKYRKTRLIDRAVTTLSITKVNNNE